LRKYAFLSPDLANPHDSMGEILSYIGNYEDAEREFIQALEIQPDFFHSLLHLARVYLEQGKIAKGVDLLEQTRSQIAGTKFEYEVDNLLVSTYYSNKLLKECDNACVRFFTNHPESFDGGFFRAIHLTGTGQYDEAQAVFDSLMTVAAEWKYFKETERGKMHYQRIQHTFNAVYADLLGEIDTAAEEWRLCLVNSDGMPPHEKFTERTAYGEVLLKLERYSEAFDQAQQILAINPRLIHPLLVYIGAATALGRFDEARTAMANLDKILENADPDLPAKEKANALRAILAKHPSS
jgi:tetratricopeptide (TPR) repeat protein